MYVFFFQAEDGIRDLVRSRGLGDVYKRQVQGGGAADPAAGSGDEDGGHGHSIPALVVRVRLCLSLIHI